MSQALSDLLTRHVGRFTDRQADWDAFADARVEGFRRAQHRFIGSGASGKADASVIPAEHFTLSVMFVPPGQGNAAHTHEVEEVFFVLLVTGRARYLDDVALPGTVHLGVVRSPHAHARVLGVDGDAASRLTGVLAVWTLADLPELARASVPPLVPERWVDDYRHPVLAADRVRHVGEAIAVVVADDPYRVADAVEC